MLQHRCRWVVLILVIGSGPGSQAALAAAPRVKLSLSAASADPGLVVSSLRQYAVALEHETQGRVSLNIDAQAAGRAPQDLIEDVQKRRITLVELPSTALRLDDPLPAMDTLPYLALNYPRAQKLWRVVRPRLAAALERRGLRLLYAIPVSAPGLISQRPLGRAGDFQGRIVLDRAGPGARLIRLTGAEALGVKADAVASAFRHQGLDFIFISPQQAVTDKAWRYARLFTPIPAWFPKHLVVAAGPWFEGLDKNLQTTLLLAGAGSERAAWAASERADIQAVQKLRDYGMTILKPPVALQLELQKLGRRMLFDWSREAGEAGAGLVEQYYAIR